LPHAAQLAFTNRRLIAERGAAAPSISPHQPDAAGYLVRMSGGNVELVRSIYADWERGEFGRTDWADPGIEVEALNQFETGVFTGLAEFARFWRGHIGAYQDWGVAAEEFRELDDERVLVLVEQRGRGRTSGIAVTLKSANVFHVRDGHVVRLVMDGDRENALADLGLEE
jgi:hypothetical protein